MAKKIRTVLLAAIMLLGAAFAVTGCDAPNKLRAPKLSVSEAGALTWEHVRFATYYLIYEEGDQTPLTDFNGEEIKIEVSDQKAGDEMSLEIDRYVVGYHALYLRAFSTKKIFTASDKSNVVKYDW